jgi:hypothetical protein
MMISLLTDAPKHNLALMKLSAYHKVCGDVVTLNEPIVPADYTYASVLFDWNVKKFIANEYGGPAFQDVPCHLPAFYSPHIDYTVDRIKPDYDLYPIDYSLGYTFRPCFNSCGFCKVPKMHHPDSIHHSIWEFHDTKFKKICLLNNNTFQDNRWKETFEEIWEADLTVVDENGYDLRLLNDEKADALKRTKFSGNIHFAWDRIVDEPLIKNGLSILAKHEILGQRVYVLIGYDTNIKEDIHRCEIIRWWGQDPFIMPYKRTRQTRAFQRFINTFMWRKYKTIEQAWKEYRN